MGIRHSLLNQRTVPLSVTSHEVHRTSFKVNLDSDEVPHMIIIKVLRDGLHIPAPLGIYPELVRMKGLRQSSSLAARR